MTMGDLVERLRKLAVNMADSPHGIKKEKTAYWKAADEIERLQARDHDPLHMQITALEDEIERLRMLLRRIMQATPHSMCSDAEAWLEAEKELVGIGAA
jgi:hypothetical protein